MKALIKKGTTSKRLPISILDSTNGTGAGLSGLAYNSSGLTWHYWREDEADAAGTSVTLADMTRGTWASGGFIEKDSTNMPGDYEIGIPDAALADGADWVVMRIQGAADMAPIRLELELIDVDLNDSVRAGLTALPNYAAAASGGLPISAAGGQNLDGVASQLVSVLSKIADIDYDINDTGGVDSYLIAIKAKTDILSEGTDVVVKSNVDANQNVTIESGDDETISLTSSDWPSLSGATVSFSFRTRDNRHSFSKAGSIAGDTVSVELTDVETGSMIIGKGAYLYNADATLSSGDKESLGQGSVTVNRNA